MSERIRSLEDALQHMQLQHSSEPHPLLRQELLAIKRSPELFGVERERNGAHQLNDQDHRRDDDEHLGASSSTPPSVLHDEVGLRQQPRELCYSLMIQTVWSIYIKWGSVKSVPSRHSR